MMPHRKSWETGATSQAATFKNLVGYAIVAAGTVLPIAAPSLASDTSVSGYLNASFTLPSLQKQEAGFFDVNALSIILQHDIDPFKFLSEVEYSGLRGSPAINTNENFPSGQASHPLETGEISVERAWAEANLAREFSLRIGKDLTPTLWWSNHYPNLTQPISRPMIVDTFPIIKENYVGVQAYGKLPHGFKYHLIAANSSTANPAAPTSSDFPQPSYLEKLDWESSLDDLQFQLGAHAAQQHDNDQTLFGVPYTSYGIEASATYRGFKLWSEIAGASGFAAGGYGVLSYDFNAGDSALLSPFFLYDYEKIHVEATTRTRYAVGIDYRPLPTIATKLECLFANRFTDSTDNDIFTPASTQLAVSFVYFFK